MNIEIDQSGKIEHTNKNTAVAFSNGVSGSIFIQAKEKREIQKFLRKSGKPRMFIYKLFAVLIFLLIKNHIKKINTIVIDVEYPGQDTIIKNLLLKEIKKVSPEFLGNNIVFRRIGKKSRAHFLAYGVISQGKSANRVVLAKEVLKFFV